MSLLLAFGPGRQQRPNLQRQLVHVTVSSSQVDFKHTEVNSLQWVVTDLAGLELWTLLQISLQPGFVQLLQAPPHSHCAVSGGPSLQAACLQDWNQRHATGQRRMFWQPRHGQTAARLFKTYSVWRKPDWRSITSPAKIPKGKTQLRGFPFVVIFLPFLLFLLSFFFFLFFLF